MLFSLCRCLQTRFHFQFDLYNLNRLELQRLENIFLFSVEKGNLWRKSVENIYREVKGRTRINIKKLKSDLKISRLTFLLCAQNFKYKPKIRLFNVFGINCQKISLTKNRVRRTHSNFYIVLCLSVSTIFKNKKF